jgi:hypothetical protein
MNKPSSNKLSYQATSDGSHSCLNIEIQTLKLPINLLINILFCYTLIPNRGKDFLK